MKASKSKSKVKVMLFNIQGIIHLKFLPQGQTVKQTIYKGILWCIVKSVCDKRQNLWEAHAWTLHHNNVPAHTALSICQFLQKGTLELWNTPNISPIWHL